MVDVILWEQKPLNLMALLVELKELGYAVGKDFDFQYVPATHSLVQEIIPRHTVFTFYNESVATWFSLKYS